jgi:predicted enzyme involved in methoxymalonyl-ACP biosynthesis
LEIDTWLMSCRVLKRGVECFLLNYLCEIARERNLKCIKGAYIPTSKNDLVREHYAQLGFSNVAANTDGHTTWELSLADYHPLSHFIKRVEVNGTNS